MKILIDIGHPGHVHLFRNLILKLSNKHEILVTAKNKEVTTDLLDSYGIPYLLISSYQNSFLRKFAYYPMKFYELFKISREFQPDLLIGVHNMYLAQLGKLTGIPSIIFTDTENVFLGDILTYPFTDTVCTPVSFRGTIDAKKHVRYEGFHELAYIHPKYFSPDPTVLKDLGIQENEKFVVVRLISLDAYHDVSLKGIEKDFESSLIADLEPFAKIFINTSKPLPPGLEKFVVKIRPEKLHSLLYYASLYIGEGATTAVEAALLGTPAIHIESNSSGEATGNFCGNFLDLRDKYRLLFFYPSHHEAVEKAKVILVDNNSKKEWLKRRDALLVEKVDVTEWMVDFIEHYPESFFKYLKEKKTAA